MFRVVETALQRGFEYALVCIGAQDPGVHCPKAHWLCVLPFTGESRFNTVFQTILTAIRLSIAPGLVPLAYE